MLPDNTYITGFRFFGHVIYYIRDQPNSWPKKIYIMQMNNTMFGLIWNSTKKFPKHMSGVPPPNT